MQVLGIFCAAVGDSSASQEDKGKEVDLGKAANSVCYGGL